MEINRTRALPLSKYFGDSPRKDLIVLHGTAGGSATSSLHWWASQPGHVATAYVVDRDGTIYEAFPPECWAYHLGIKGTHDHDRRSIGIELANWGPLALKGGKLRTYSGVELCDASETDRYVQTEYRGREYWEAYPERQQIATLALVDRLAKDFNIPLGVHHSVRAGICHPAWAKEHRGIATHTNFRADKWDIGPAGELLWDKIEGL